MGPSVYIPLDEYRELNILKGRVESLFSYARKRGYLSIDDALLVLGYEQEEHGNVGEQDGT